MKAPPAEQTEFVFVGQTELQRHLDIFARRTCCFEIPRQHEHPQGTCYADGPLPPWLKPDTQPRKKRRSGTNRTLQENKRDGLASAGGARA